MTRHSGLVLAILRIPPGPSTEDELAFVLALRRDRDNASMLLRWPAASARDQAVVFGSPGAKRLWLDVMSHNARDGALSLAQGFIEEGRLCQCIEVDGRRVSLSALFTLEREFIQERQRAGLTA